MKNVLIEYIKEKPRKKVVIVGNTSKDTVDRIYVKLKNGPTVHKYDYFTGVLHMTNGTKIYAIMPNCTGLSYGEKYFKVDVLLFTAGTRQKTKEDFLKKFSNRIKDMGKLRSDA